MHSCEAAEELHSGVTIVIQPPILLTFASCYSLTNRNLMQLRLSLSIATIGQRCLRSNPNLARVCSNPVVALAWPEAGVRATRNSS